MLFASYHGIRFYIGDIKSVIGSRKGVFPLRCFDVERDRITGLEIQFLFVVRGTIAVSNGDVLLRGVYLHFIAGIYHYFFHVAFARGEADDSNEKQETGELLHVRRRFW